MPSCSCPKCGTAATYRADIRSIADCYQCDACDYIFPLRKDGTAAGRDLAPSARPEDLRRQASVVKAEEYLARIASAIEPTRKTRASR